MRQEVRDELDRLHKKIEGVVAGIKSWEGVALRSKVDKQKLEIEVLEKEIAKINDIFKIIGFVDVKVFKGDDLRVNLTGNVDKEKIYVYKTIPGSPIERMFGEMKALKEGKKSKKRKKK